MNNTHPYNKHSIPYNFLFHPFHEKKTTAYAIITNVVLTIFTGFVWQFLFWTVNRLDNKKLCKLHLDPCNNQSDPTANRVNQTAEMTLNPSTENTSISQTFDEMKNDIYIFLKEQLDAVSRLQFPEDSDYTIEIVQEDLRRFVDQELKQCSSEKELKNFKDRIINHLSLMVEALPFHLRLESLNYSDYPRIGINNPRGRRCFFISCIQMLVHTRINDYALLRPLPDPVDPDTLQPPIQPEEPILETFNEQEPRLDLNVQNLLDTIKTRLDQINNLAKTKRIRIDQQKLLPYKKLQEEELTDEEFKKYLNDAKLNYLFPNRNFEDINAKRNAYIKSLKQYHTDKKIVEDRNKELQNQYHAECEKHLTQQLNYQSDLYELKQSKQNYDSLTTFQSKLRQVVFGLRNGSKPGKQEIFELGELCGVVKEGKFSGDTEQVFKKISLFTLESNAPHWTRETDQVNEYLNNGECSAWICGNGRHVWCYVQTENKKIYEINNSSSFKKANSWKEFKRNKNSNMEIIF